MKGSRDVIEMEENGEIVFNENTGCYEPTNWTEMQAKDMHEIRNDAIYQEERERRAGFFEENK